jgi:hypothetical protein
MGTVRQICRANLKSLLLLLHRLPRIVLVRSLGRHMVEKRDGVLRHSAHAGQVVDGNHGLGNLRQGVKVGPCRTSHISCNAAAEQGLRLCHRFIGSSQTIAQVARSPCATTCSRHAGPVTSPAPKLSDPNRSGADQDSIISCNRQSLVTPLCSTHCSASSGWALVPVLSASSAEYHRVSSQNWETMATPSCPH